jgi:hypothetical protein
MSEELMRPGSLTGVLARAKALGLLRSAEALTATALVIERRAKELLNQQVHQYGTHTPASPGGPPAKISGQLQRSVTHVTTKVADDIVIRIGPADTPRVPYQRIKANARTSGHRRVRARSATNGQVGKYLETGLKGGQRYPWLLPAFKEGIATVAGVYRTSFSQKWDV